MITVNAAIKLAVIVDKMGLKVSQLQVSDTGNAKKDQEAVGLLLIDSMIKGASKAGQDIIEFIAAYKGVSIEEAANLDFVTTIKEIFADAGVASFFK